MNDSKFPKLIDYEALKSQFSEDDPNHHNAYKAELESPLIFKHTPSQKKYSKNTFQQNTVNDSNDHEMDHHIDPESTEKKRPGLTGTRLRSYAFAVLTRKEYSKKDLIEKLALYADHREEVLTLVEELSREKYQSDQRVAEMVVRSQIRKGKGPNRIKLALRAKSIDNALAKHDMNEVDWYEEAYQLKIKKYGTDVAKDPKIKAKQIRFLQYRGFEMDAIMKAITRKESQE